MSDHRNDSGMQAIQRRLAADGQVFRREIAALDEASFLQRTLQTLGLSPEDCTTPPEAPQDRPVGGS